MFIKIKIEPRGDQEVDEHNFKPSSFFEVNDESTVCEVKLLIEKNIDVPAERQEIRTLTRTLEDNEKLADIGELMRSTGSAIMLYIYAAGAYEQHDEEPIFHAFLQLYTADEAAVQQDYEKQLRNSVCIANHKPPSVTSTITLVGDSRSEYEDASDVNTSTEEGSESSSESDSGSSSENTEQEKARLAESTKKRRYTTELNETKEKRAKRYTVLTKISPHINTYLEEFPNTSKYAEKPSDPDADKSQTTSKACTEEPAQVSMTTSTTQSTVAIAEKSTPQVDESIQKPAGSPSTTTEDKEPCAFITPEQRAFIVILSNIDEGKQIEKSECIELLTAFFDIFKFSENSAQLKFYGNSGPTLFKGQIWLACQDEETMIWTLAKSNSVSAIHKAHKFSVYFNLKKYQVVIPSVAKSKNLFDIFDLIERQNSDIKTTKWSVLERHIILDDKDEFYDKCVSCLCPNEMLVLELDTQTLNALEKNNYTLNYCFWKIKFEQIALAK